MLTGFAHLFEKTKERVAIVRNIKTTDFVDVEDQSRLYNRSIQLCTLDAMLSQHRLDYGTRYNPLNGTLALHHKLLLKYKWPLHEIRSLSLADCLLALHDELNMESIPESASKILKSIAANQFAISFPDIHDEEWDPALAEKLIYNSEER